MRRYQCTTREFLAFTFRKIYPEVACPEGFKRTHAESIFLIDDHGDTHEMWPNWVFNNFKELPSDDLDEMEAEEYRMMIPDGHLSRGCAYAIAFLLTAAAIAFTVIKYRS